MSRFWRGILAPQRPAPPATAQTLFDGTPHTPVVVMLDGIYHLELDYRTLVPLSQGGEPLRSVGHGWRVQGVYLAFAPVLLLELVDEGGQRGTWYFDAGGSYVGNTLAGLPPSCRQTVVQKATAILSAQIAPLFRKTPAPTGKAADPFFQISHDARREIASACQPALFPPVAFRLLADLPEAFLLGPPGPACAPAVIRRRTVAGAMNDDFQARLIIAAQDGHFSWRSPVDGQYRPSTAGLCLNHFAFAYRFEDEASDLTFFVLASDHNATFIGLYFPAEGWIVVRDETALRLAGLTFTHLVTLIVDHIGDFGETLIPYLWSDTAKTVAGSMRESHIGHLLWNELTGLDALTSTLPPGKLPEILPLGGPSHAWFGPLETLFPELAGRVRTELRTKADIVDYAHRHDLLLARFTGDCVSDRLRQRLLGHARSTPDGQAIMARRRRARGPVIMIGIRVENRTAIDLAGFLARLARYIATVLPTVQIVLDGQNCSAREQLVHTASTFAAELAVRPLAETELELCQQIARDLQASGIALEITSGKPVAASLAWADGAAGIVSFWGAGLAKYRWAANRPVLALTNRINLLRRQDLHIYSLPRYMDDPAPMEFADPLAIEDDSAGLQLIPQHEPFSYNFHVNEEIFFAQVRRFIATLAVPE